MFFFVDQRYNKSYFQGYFYQVRVDCDSRNPTFLSLYFISTFVARLHFLHSSFQFTLPTSLCSSDSFTRYHANIGSTQSTTPPPSTLLNQTGFQRRGSTVSMPPVELESGTMLNININHDFSLLACALPGCLV